MAGAQQLKNLVHDFSVGLPTGSGQPFILAERGQRVHVAPEHACSGECGSAVWEITDVRNTRGGSFVSLRDHRTGATHKWHKTDELLPARSFARGPMPRVADTERSLAKEQGMTTTLNLAARFEQRANQIADERRVALANAVRIASEEDAAGAESYRLAGLGASTVLQATPRQTFSLSVRAGESFDDVAQRVADERRIPLREAVHLVGIARPDLANAR